MKRPLQQTSLESMKRPLQQTSLELLNEALCIFSHMNERVVQHFSFLRLVTEILQKVEFNTGFYGRPKI